MYEQLVLLPATVNHSGVSHVQQMAGEQLVKELLS